MLQGDESSYGLCMIAHNERTGMHVIARRARSSLTVDPPLCGIVSVARSRENIAARPPALASLPAKRSTPSEIARLTPANWSAARG